MPVGDKRVTIQHRDGREYSIDPKDFTNPRVSPDRKSYAEQGFHIVRYVNGEPYDGPKTQREIEKAQEARQARREVTKSAPAAAEKAKAS